MVYSYTQISQYLHLGLCLDNKEMVNINLIRKPGASDLDWLDELLD